MDGLFTKEEVEEMNEEEWFFLPLYFTEEALNEGQDWEEVV